MTRIHITYLLLLCFCSIGCSHRTLRAKGPASRPVCFSKEEVARIQAFKVRCRKTIKQERLQCNRDLLSVRINRDATVHELNSRLQLCYNQCRIATNCRSPLAIALIVGATGLVVGIGGTFAVLGIMQAIEQKP